MKKIVLPLQQHVGIPCVPIVSRGENVQRGQLLAKPTGLGAHIHCSYKHIVKKITKNTVKEAGVVGTGGAGFPTAVKLKTAIPDGVFIANGATCEPYEPNTDVCRPPDRYPAGDERVIVREITGIALKPGQLPETVGACIDTVETITRSAEAIELRKPTIDNDVTVSGRVKKQHSVFVDVPLGTPAKDLLEQAGGYVKPRGEIVIGRPMTGRSGSEVSPVTKTSGPFLVAMPSPQETRKADILLDECGGSAEQLTQIAESMDATVVAKERCKRMVEVDGRYRHRLPGRGPGQAENVLALKRAGTQVLVVGTYSQ